MLGRPCEPADHECRIANGSLRSSMDEKASECAMPWVTSLFLEPVYRMVFGAPLKDFDFEASDGVESQDPQRTGLVLVADGVGGLELCGIALRYVLGAEQLPYSIQVLAWGHGFGRWHADLTDVGNRDAKAQSVAGTVRRYKTERPEIPVFLVAKSGGRGSW